jgi:hypothetical protein
MRYTIKAPDDQAYHAILRLLNEERIQVALTSARRHLIAALDVSPRLQKELVARGARVTEDYQYNLEHVPTH